MKPYIEFDQDTEEVVAIADPLQLQTNGDICVEGGQKRWPGDNVFRILVPAKKVGSIIGRKGEFIKKMCEETRARNKILEGPPGSLERA
ncbi:hypothetical protein Dimus_036220, partial [Dionaea muscipula]